MNPTWKQFKPAKTNELAYSTLTLPSIYVEIPAWVGYSVCLRKTDINNVEGFSIQPLAEPISDEYVLCVSYPVAGSTTQSIRYKLWEGVGEVVSATLYQGQIIGPGAYLELWTTINSPNPVAIAEDIVIETGLTYSRMGGNGGCAGGSDSGNCSDGTNNSGGTQGPPGPPGPQGPQGEPGANGAAATVAVGSTTTGAPGTDATVTNSGSSSAAVLNFTIPRGNTGADGPPGSPGSPGTAATIAVGEVNTVPYGSPATVTNVGSSSAALFDFDIPQGPQGIQGDPGTPGTPGSAATVAAGSTTTGAPGSSAAVANVGTSSAAIFNFTIPRGDVGATGSPGPAPSGTGLVAVSTGVLDTPISTIAGLIAKIVDWPGYLPLTGGTLTGNLQFSGPFIPGLVHNNLTALQIAALVAPPIGATVFNTTSSQLNMWNGSVWSELRTGNYVLITGSTMTGALVNDPGAALTVNQPNVIRQTWNNAAVAFNGLLIDITSTANLSSTFLDCYDDTNRRFWVTTGGTLNCTQSIFSADVTLLRDASNVLGQRNGTTAQRSRIYNTYTDASNYERGFVEWVTNVFRIGTEKLGTGVARALELIVDGTTRLSISTAGVPTFTTDQLRLSAFKTPSSASDTGVAGTFCYDTNFIYICTATNTWKRVAIATW